MLPWHEYVTMAIRYFLACALVLSFIALGWFVAWKLLLVHIPFVQEICGLRKKPKKQPTSKPTSPFPKRLPKAKADSSTTD